MDETSRRSENVYKIVNRKEQKQLELSAKDQNKSFILHIPAGEQFINCETLTPLNNEIVGIELSLLLHEGIDKILPEKETVYHISTILDVNQDY